MLEGPTRLLLINSFAVVTRVNTAQSYRASNRMHARRAHLRFNRIVSIELNGIDGPNVRHGYLSVRRVIKQCRGSRLLHEACRVKSEYAGKSARDFPLTGRALYSSGYSGKGFARPTDVPTISRLLDKSFGQPFSITLVPCTLVQE